jgi:nudix motif 8
VDVLGEIGPAEMNLRGDMRVWPYVVSPFPDLSYLTLEFWCINITQGFIHQKITHIPKHADDPLPSLDLSSIHMEASQSEVDRVFQLPLAALAAPSRIRSYLFRGQRPYWAVDVSGLDQTVKGGNIDIEVVAGEVDIDLSNLTKAGAMPFRRGTNEVGYRKGRLEVWGLTGWYLSLLMRTLQVYR